MTLATHEFIRRFLMHVLPKGFQRIRHYGLLANRNRTRLLAKARELLAMAPREKETADEQTAGPVMLKALPCPCPRCGGLMIVIEILASGWTPAYRPPLTPIIRLDTS